jgi:hypothetical protein
MGTATVSGGATAFSPLGGTGAGGAPSTQAPGLTPNVALTVSGLAARAYGLGGGEQVTITLQVENVDTALACTVSAAASLCEIPGTLNLAARSTVGVKLVSTAFVGTRVVSWSWTFT